MFTASLRGLWIPRPDIIFIEAQPVFTSLAGVFLSRWKRTPYVLDVSDLWPDHLLSVGAISDMHPVYRLARRVVDGIYRGATAIVALHDALAQGIQQHIGPTDKVQTIYVGTDLSRFRPGLDTTAFRQKHGLGDGKLVTFIGTFATPYDFEVMFAVARHFVTRSDIRFAFIGSGSQSETVRRRLAGGELPNVCWLGWIDHAEMPLAWAASYVTYWALRNHDLYRGTFPAKSYEAMACGTPIAAAMDGLGADILARSGGGLAVPFGDAEGLTFAVERLLDEPGLRDQCSRAARAYAEQHFDYEKSVLAYEETLIKAAQR
jgi:glycosyltransferase involved in cell wall biosynthesis